MANKKDEQRNQEYLDNLTLTENDFAKLQLYPDELDMDKLTVFKMIDDRVTEIEKKLQNKSAAKIIEILSDEEYLISYMDLYRRLAQQKKKSNGYDEGLLSWIRINKQRYMDRLLIGLSEDDTDQAQLNNSLNLELPNFAHLTDEIDDLYVALKKNKFISSALKPAQFYAVFSKKNVEHQIVWNGTQGELNLLLRNFKGRLVNNHDIWKRASLIFRPAKGKAYTNTNLGHPQDKNAHKREPLFRKEVEKLLKKIEALRRL